MRSDFGMSTSRSSIDWTPIDSSIEARSSFLVDEVGHQCADALRHLLVAASSSRSEGRSPVSSS